MAGSGRHGAPPPGRDFAAEIDAAVRAATGGSGLVLVSGEPVSLSRGAARTLRFVRPGDDGIPRGPWERFGAEVGEVLANGDTLLAGLGIRAAGSDAVERARDAGLAAAPLLESGACAVLIDDDDIRYTSALIDGLASGYPGTEQLVLHVDPSTVEQAARGVLGSDVVRVVRALSNGPPAVVTPERAAAWAADIALGAGLDCTTLGPDEVAAAGFGGLAAIGAGSSNGPHLVELRYAPPEARARVALVGKGVTFDSGGLSLKSPTAMQSMRLDVTGAATVLGVMAGLARLRLPIEVHAVLPFAENLPGPGAARPGDVVRAWSGTQIQLLDIDFEGRVILADALALAASEGPDLLVDLATLTYQAEIALGAEIGAVIGRDESAVRLVLDAAATAGEPAWALPWAPRYLDQVRTPFGVRNHPLRDSGRALTAALFLGEFVPEDVPWAHIDMTGPSWRGDASGDGATGYGARTLLALLEAL